MIARGLWAAVTLLMLGGVAQAQCTDQGPIDVPAGFGISSDALMAENDTTIAFFIMGAVDATLRSAVLGADAGCIKQLAVCTEGKNAEAIAAVFRRTVIAIPANRAQPAQQVVFNIVFGDCFRTFMVGEPA
jgi:hypothetical protein